MTSLYQDCKLSAGHPELERLAVTTFLEAVQGPRSEEARVWNLLTCLGRLVDLIPPRRILVLGCGPVQFAIRIREERVGRIGGAEVLSSFALATRVSGTGECRMRAPAPACLPHGPTPRAAPHGRRRPCRGAEK